MINDKCKFTCPLRHFFGIFLPTKMHFPFNLTASPMISYIPPSAGYIPIQRIIIVIIISPNTAKQQIKIVWYRVCCSVMVCCCRACTIIATNSNGAWMLFCHPNVIYLFELILSFHSNLARIFFSVLDHFSAYISNDIYIYMPNTHNVYNICQPL